MDVKGPIPRMTRERNAFALLAISPPLPTPTVDTSLGETMQWLRNNFSKVPVDCPCCGQIVALRDRAVHSGVVRSMLLLYRAGGTKEFVYKPGVTRAGTSNARDDSQLRFWGLLEEELKVREDGGRAGYWRVTPKGERFLRGEITVPKKALTFDRQCWGFEDEQVDVHQALGTRFDLGKLLDGDL